MHLFSSVGGHSPEGTSWEEKKSMVDVSQSLNAGYYRLISSASIYSILKAI
jgi:hypothetical protein